MCGHRVRTVRVICARLMHRHREGPVGARAVRVVQRRVGQVVIGMGAQGVWGHSSVQPRCRVCCGVRGGWVLVRVRGLILTTR